MRLQRLLLVSVAGAVLVGVGIALSLLLSQEGPGYWDQRGSQGRIECGVILEPSDPLQLAIDQAEQGEVICLQEGTWEENIKLGKTLMLRGQGPGITAIKAATEGLPVIWVSGRGIEVRLEGLMVTGAFGGCADRSRSVCPYGLLARGSARVVLKDSQISGNWFALRAEGAVRVGLADARVVNNGGGPIEILNHARMTFENSFISGDSIKVKGAAEVTLSNSQVIGKGVGSRDGLELKDSTSATILSSEISTHGMSGLVVEDSARVTIQDSLISGNGGSGLLLGDSALGEVRESRFVDNALCAIAAFHKARVHGASNEMRGNGTDLCGLVSSAVRKPLVMQTDRKELSVPSDYTTVQEAVDAVAPGGTITLAEGTFVGGVTIWKPLTIRGAGRERTIIQAGEGKKAIVSIPRGEPDVHLVGLAVNGSAGHALFVYSQAGLHDLRISGNNWGGIKVGGDAKTRVAIYNSEISDSMFGILISGSSQVIIQSSQVSGNKIAGLEIEDSAKVTVQDSQISGNGAWGLQVGGHTRVTLTGTHVSDSYWGGLGVSGSAWVTIQDSVIERNGSRARIEECKSALRWCSGISLRYGAPRVRIVRSQIRNNINWGIVAELKRCGSYKNDFRGRITFEEMDLEWISGNNTAGNLDSMGNPGHHPWNRPEVPDGQVCR